jgi:CelD/BcsL family acetyltransferase involved in cellulose biosynthesis/RimJ/RimL family protein N-acetyltransferase
MERIDIEVMTGTAAYVHLERLQADGSWERLLGESRNGTAFQHAGFALPWYSLYSAEWEPVVAVGRSGTHELAGLWLLARERNAPARLTHVGAHQAEYHVWLARSESEREFVSAAWKALGKVLSLDGLCFKYLPDPASSAALQAAVGHAGSLKVIRHPRPLLQLNAEELAKTAAKKGNRSKLNRLKRQGALSYQRLTTPEEFAAHFPDLVDLYDFRQAAVNGGAPFREDSLKAEFHQRLFSALGSERLYVSVTLLDGRPIAGFFGLISRGIAHLGLLISDPVLAALSPGKLHLMQVAAQLHALGVHTLDLTPGGDPWKDRFANAADAVLQLTYFASRWAAARLSAGERFARLAKRSLKRVGFSPEQLRNTVRTAGKLNLTRVSRVWSTWARQEREYRIYKITRAAAANCALESSARRNDLAGLLAFKADESWQNRTAFLRAASERLESGSVVFTQSDHVRLFHSGWLTLHQKQSFVTEVEQSIDLPDGCAVLWDFYTAPAYRGRGTYRQTLRHMLAYAFQQPDIVAACIGVLADNLPSRRVIEGLGFDYQGSAFLSRRFGRTRTWNTLNL